MIKSLKILFAIIIVISSSCGELDEIERPVIWDGILRIPVVVHVVNYSPDPFEISEEIIQSQFDVLNKDFRKQNSDVSNTPQEFEHLVADVEIEFYLASSDPDGNPTSGIIRNSSEITGFDGYEVTYDEAHLYFTNRGGQDAWPRDRYLNIWIADLSNRLGQLGLPGYSNPVDGEAWRDGVVIDSRVFGLSPNEPSHDLGRTATHEIGHWLSLKHIFGQNDSCEVGDEVDDTPTAYAQYNGVPTHPQSSCGSNDMFMNFMDYVKDEAMCMFTKGQKDRMWELFEVGGARRELFINLTTESN